MRNNLVALALVATAMAQGVTQTIAPPGAAPAGCVADMNGKYELTVDAIAPGVAKRAEPVTNTLIVTLEKGVLKDRYNRVGYIASNRQFQFDGPPQAGALFTGGWSLCSNGSLALGSTTVFYRCLSGEFYNLYDSKWAPHCSGIHLSAHQASPEAINEIPPAGAAPGPTPTVSSSPVVIVPPASTTITDASALSSSISSLSSAASSASSSASAVSTAVAGGGSLLPPNVTVAPPVDPSQTGAASVVHVGNAAASSFAVVLALVAMIFG